MNITVDSNVLIRYTMMDDPVQSELARKVIDQAETICIPSLTLCEYVRVLATAYGLSRAEITQAIGAILEADNVRVDQFAVDKALAMLEAGGDFADGVIAFEGQWLGADEFVTFNQPAAEMLNAAGIPARYLA